MASIELQPRRGLSPGEHAVLVYYLQEVDEMTAQARAEQVTWEYAKEVLADTAIRLRMSLSDWYPRDDALIAQRIATPAPGEG